MQREKGFTLIEMIVAVALFAVVMLVSVGALLALVVANRKAQALQSVMNNLNVSLDGMVRSIRMGSEYDGSDDCSGNDTGHPLDCTSGATTFSFRAFNGDRLMYFYDDGRIYKSETGRKDDGIPITAPIVKIDALQFYVVGTEPGAADEDRVQPKVVMIIKGTAAANDQRIRTTFAVQATAVQRLLDI